jgi:regulator of sigma E protease
MVTGLIVIAILVLLIVVHEFGHFVAAKIFGVRVEEFGIGYPPRAFTFGRWGGTEYTLNWIPFGGFVRLFGEPGEGQRGRGSLVDSPRWKQAAILIAGVAMNAVCAWVLFATALHLGVPQVVGSRLPGEHARLMVGDVVPASPADAAGIKPGDEVTGLQDNTGMQLAELTPEQMVAFVSARGGRPMTIFYTHAGKQESAYVTPANAVIPGAAGRPALGLALALVAQRSQPWAQAMVHAFPQTGAAFVSVGKSLWGLLASALRGAPDLTGVIGPVGIVSYVGEAAQNGIGSVLLLAAVISVNLVIINLIPIPALDGGRLLVLIVEGVRRKAAPRLVIQSLNFIGVSLIILLMIVVTFHDVKNLLI